MKKLFGIIVALGCVIAPLALVAGCKQKEGERCQVDEDCEDSLSCSTATQTCGPLGGGAGLDALVPDAPAGFDAGVDAVLDAPLDAPPDAI